MAGDYAESDKACERFLTSYPASPLLPHLLFRYAENACLRARAADPEGEAAWQLDEVIRRYRVLADRYPESPNINRARRALADAYCLKGDVDRARAVLEAIPPAERTGDLADVPYRLADVLMRSAPAEAEDAVTAGRLEDELRTVAALLDAFAAFQPDSPQAADALFKLGYRRRRLANLADQPADRTVALVTARAVYERLLDKYSDSPLAPQAVFERAKCLVRQKDLDGAASELRRFLREERLKNSAVAPLAVLELATLPLQRSASRLTTPGE